jgi:hypothetical protein
MNSVLTMQAAALREMSVEDKVRISEALWEEAREVTAAGVRGRHPEWSEDRVAARVRDLLSAANP